MTPTVVAIVLNWNNAQDTIACLFSLSAQDTPYDVLVVDNGSTDDSVARIRDSHPNVKILQTGANLGYAGGNNAGIRIGLDSGADYVLLLNNDTVVDPHMLSALLEAMESDPRIGMAGPTILYHDHPDVIWCGGAAIDWRTGSTTRLRADEIYNPRFENPVDVDFLSGCALLVRRRLLDAIGLMDDRYFLYYEETDWCQRAKAYGWRVAFVPGARLLHKVSASLGQESPVTDYYMARNAVLFLRKNGRGLGRYLAIARVILSNAQTALLYTLKSDDGAIAGHRNARLLALRDALLGRWGKMGACDATACQRKV